MSVEQKCLELWGSTNRVHYSMRIEISDAISEALAFHLSNEFGKRDRKYGKPDFVRLENSGNLAVINFTMQDFAETFFGDFKPKDITERLMEFTDPDSFSEDVFQLIEELENYFIRAYVYPVCRRRGRPKFINGYFKGAERYEFYRIFSPDCSAEELKKAILKKYWSESKYGEIKPPFDPEGLSPLLKVGKQDIVTGLKGNSGNEGIKKYLIQKLLDKKEEISKQDELRIEFLMKFHHPLLILYNWSIGKDKLPFAGGRAEVLPILEQYYPSLSLYPNEGFFEMVKMGHGIPPGLFSRPHCSIETFKYIK